MWSLTTPRCARLWSLTTIKNDTRGCHFHRWSGAELNRRPTVFQTAALPTELPDHLEAGGFDCTETRRKPLAGTTGFEPATSGLTGRRELQTSPRSHLA